MQTMPLLGAAAATFTFNVGFGFLVHRLALGKVYRLEGAFFRDDAGARARMGWLFAGWALFNVIFCVVFINGHPRPSVGDGVSYGLAMGLLLVAVHLSLFAILPMTARLAAAWVATDVVATTATGALMAAVYAGLQ